MKKEQVMDLKINGGGVSYPIHIERRAMDDLAPYMDIRRRVLILTDQNIPNSYVERVAGQCLSPTIVTVTPGEGSKSLATYEEVVQAMIDHQFSRKDCLLALGGGVVGDLGGLVAASYMRGIDFYTVPTSLLAQIDSSIGGKTALNFAGLKNMIGAFHHPRAVVVDPDSLESLPERQFNNGMAEVIKTALILDPALYRALAEGRPPEIEEVISACLRAKAKVVGEDFRDLGVRQVLNFGHTVGHAIEASSDLLHGESVAIGMTYFASDAVLESLLPLLKSYRLPSRTDIPPETLYQALLHDKKMGPEGVRAIFLDRVGQPQICQISREEIRTILESRVKAIKEESHV